MRATPLYITTAIYITLVYYIDPHIIVYSKVLVFRSTPDSILREQQPGAGRTGSPPGVNNPPSGDGSPITDVVGKSPGPKVVKSKVPGNPKPDPKKPDEGAMNGPSVNVVSPNGAPMNVLPNGSPVCLHRTKAHVTNLNSC